MNSEAAGCRSEVIGGTEDARDKGRRLRELLTTSHSVIVAFSGGVDSAYLAWAATRSLGDSALCITAESPSYPDHHRQLALDVARRFGLRHDALTIKSRQARSASTPLSTVSPSR